MAKKSAYEESREQRMEANRKMMEQLKLKNLAQAIPVKPSPMKKAAVKPRVPKEPLDPTFVRKSSRDKPVVSYKEVKFERMERLGRRSSKKRDLSDRDFVPVEARELAIQRAYDLQSGLNQKYPSFVKPMVHSHVNGGFWLGLPVGFCRAQLPRYGVEFEYTLIDQQGKGSPTKYLVPKKGLSAGWRGFAIDHNLIDGDALVFHLIKKDAFKVYIIRWKEQGDYEN